MKMELRALALPILAGAAALSFAAEPPSELALCEPQEPCRTASHAELDALRGGFSMQTERGHLRVGIGITRSVAVNDRVVAVSELTIPDLGQAFEASRRPGQRAPQALPGGNALIVQNGPGNVAPPASAFGTAALPTIVQNTLDNQKLGTVTIINATVNSLSVMHALRTSDMLTRATAASGR